MILDPRGVKVGDMEELSAQNENTGNGDVLVGGGASKNLAAAELYIPG